jgi:hypothetical protein
MASAAAKKGDKISVAATPPYVHTLTKPDNTTEPGNCDFSATISQEVSTDVYIGTSTAAVCDPAKKENGSHASLDAKPGVWAPPLLKTGQISGGSGSVFINGKKAVRHGDPASCCGSTGSVVVDNAGNATVFIGD